MKIKSILGAATLGLAILSVPLWAQSEGGNTGPGGAGGNSGNTGSGSSEAGKGARGINGGQAVSGGNTPVAPDTNAPSGAEFHPPPTASHPDQQR